MIEIIGGIYVVSFILSLFTLSWYYNFVNQSFNSKKYLTLNENLKQLNLFWSNTNSDFAELTDHGLHEDQRKAKRTIFMIGILAFASFPGLLLIIASVLSMRYLARPRRELFVFQSALAEQTLPLQQVHELVNEAKQRG